MSPRVRSVLAILGALAFMILIGRDLWVRRRYGTDSAQYREITHVPAVAGYQHARLVNDDDASDADLIADQRDMGAMWAKDNHPNALDECPRYSPSFERGCQDASKGK